MRRQVELDMLEFGRCVLDTFIIGGKTISLKWVVCVRLARVLHVEMDKCEAYTSILRHVEST